MIMKTIKNILNYSTFMLVILFAVSGCKKTVRPELGDYPQDANPPGGPLKFYVAFDGTTSNPLMNAVDSTRANFPASNTGEIADGISGKCYKGSETAFAKYAGANEFTKASSFTIAFWIKGNGPTPGGGTDFVFSLDSKGYSWTNTKLFLEFEDWSTPTVGNGKFYINDQWIEYINANGMPNLFNGNWHQLVFTYDGSSSTLKAYIDGAIFRTNTVGSLGPINFGNFDSFTIGGPNQYTHDQNTWMGFWEGNIDQFRLYDVVLSDSEITALFNSKL
jgi:Concanavalin A-like lectin/glucanases superfamily